MIRQLATALITTLALLAGHGAAAADANSAGTAELEAVKGIGPALSAKILAARQQAPFKNWPDLLDRVSGMGPGNAARLSQAGLTVAGAAYAPMPAADAPARPTAKTPTKEPAKEPAKEPVKKPAKAAS